MTEWCWLKKWKAASLYWIINIVMYKYIYIYNRMLDFLDHARKKSLRMIASFERVTDPRLLPGGGVTVQYYIFSEDGSFWNERSTSWEGTLHLASRLSENELHDRNGRSELMLALQSCYHVSTTDEIIERNAVRQRSWPLGANRFSGSFLNWIEPPDQFKADPNLNQLWDGQTPRL